MGCGSARSYWLGGRWYVNRMRERRKYARAKLGAAPRESASQAVRHRCGIFISCFYDLNASLEESRSSAPPRGASWKSLARVNEHESERSMHVRTNRVSRCALYGCFERCRSVHRHRESLYPGTITKDHVARACTRFCEATCLYRLIRAFRNDGIDCKWLTDVPRGTIQRSTE